MVCFVRMSVTFVVMVIVTVSLVSMSVVMAVVVTAALGNLNIEMGFLITHGYVYCSVTGTLGSKLEMVHSAMVGIGRCSVALAAQSEQQ
jgi:hypothetical protein